ncbi:MAG: RdgB/HAM1 family non-canonical purine NTP pyrophosphatase [Chloroflexota bacterium]|nr:RdgB/HAM1 family non-canonical purine NTP pyrophosphatase [Chloroflexota bacterium]
MSQPQLLIATGNAHKLREYQSLLARVPVTLRSMHDVRTGDLPEETGETFEENALLKARHCVRTTGLPSLADDSGLAVDALGGEPGVRSVRWAGPSATDADRVRLLLDRVRGVPSAERGARFVCVVAVVGPDGAEQVFRGTLEGRLAEDARGSGGFGYDPILFLPRLERTVAELAPTEKNQISHRAVAVRAAMPYLCQLFPAEE